MIIGICGGSGSGKTTLLKRIEESFKDKKPSVFSMDNYYYPIEKQQLDRNGIVNFDLPTALNENLLTADFKKLVTGQTIEVKEYHFNVPPNRNVIITLNPSELIIVEGLFLFHYEEIRNSLDFSVFVDVDPKIQLDRRLYRDQETRNYSYADIIYQWENHVKPCYENYLLPYKNSSDFIFKNNQDSETEFLKLEEIIKNKLG